jgi:aminoglycoside phosphotransferase (APT) family kinase protein
VNEIVNSKIKQMVGEIHTNHLLSEQGCTSEVRRLATSEGIFLLKSSYKDKYRSWLRTEAQVLEALGPGSEMPVPKYYGFIETEDASHLIMTFEEGITLTTALKQAKSQTEREDLLTSFGHFLQNFHEMNPNEKRRQNEDWLNTQLERAQNYVNAGLAEGDQALLDSLKRNKPTPVKQTMIHGDCTTDNVLVREGKVYLFIDVSGMIIGDPRYDEALAIGRIVKTPDDLNAFYRGYTRYRISKEEYQYFDEGLYAFF